MSRQYLCIGDFVTLNNTKIQGYVQARISSSAYNSLVAYPDKDKEFNFPELSVVTFQICNANQYKADKQYRKLAEKCGQAVNDYITEREFRKYKSLSEKEERENELEQEKTNGQALLYGQIIQLKHVFTGKYIHVCHQEVAHIDNNALRVKLLPYNHKTAQFKIMPKHKVKSEGNLVAAADLVILESMKSTGQYLHVCTSPFSNSSPYNKAHEVDLSVISSGFILNFLCPAANGTNSIQPGRTVRFFHKDIEAYLCADENAEAKGGVQVHLRVRPKDYNIPKTVFPSTSAIVYWQMELQGCPVSAKPLRWAQPVLLRHVVTGMYLTVTPDNKLSHSYEREDPNAVFKLHPVTSDKLDIEKESFCRIQHLKTALFMQALPDTIEFADSKKLSSCSLQSLQWTKAECRKLKMGKMTFADVFILQTVNTEDTRNNQVIQGHVPWAKHLLGQLKGGKSLSSAKMARAREAVNEITHFMEVDGLPDKRRQKLLRNHKLVDSLIEMLDYTPYPASIEASNAFKAEVCAALRGYLRGDSRKNELYFARHFDLFEKHLKDESVLGASAAVVLMELIKDNRTIVDRVTQAHIKDFIKLLKKKPRDKDGVKFISSKHHTYLDLLSVLCVCEDIPIPENQRFITDTWLNKPGKTLKYLFYADAGQNIGLETNIMYISTNAKKTWSTLEDFLMIDRTNKENEIAMFESQLDLFVNLCQGLNHYSIEVITENLCLITWEEAFLCLTNDVLPDGIRAKYCYLINELFLGFNDDDTYDTMQLTFTYSDAVSPASKSITTSASPQIDARIKQLQAWINSFLDDHRGMVASEIGLNKLIGNVLQLVHTMLKRGFYNCRTGTEALITPLISLLDGSNDLPYPLQSDDQTSDDVFKYRQFTRYKPSAEANVIVEAKYQAMLVVDLFMNKLFNARIQEFQKLFKHVQNMASSVDTYEVLAPLLYSHFTTSSYPQVVSATLGTLDQMMQRTALYKGVDITSVLMDLMNYQYDYLISKAHHLLNNYYSAYESLFHRAEQAKIALTDQSCSIVNRLQKTVPSFRRLCRSILDNTTTNQLVATFAELKRLCCCDADFLEPHKVNQQIIFNMGVLNDVFNLLEQKVDMDLQEQYTHLSTSVKEACHFLRIFARENNEVKHRLLHRLDLLLRVQGAPSEMALLLTEVFTSYKTACTKILPDQIGQIVQKIAIHKSEAPELLGLLRAVVKMEELNLPLKRNQDHVVRFLTQYRNKIFILDTMTSQERLNLLQGPPSPMKRYVVELVDLLAMCCEGENDLIESICCKMLSVEEVLTILNSDVTDDVTRSFLLFLIWVYVNTGGSNTQANIEILGKNSMLWTNLDDIISKMDTVTDFIETHNAEATTMFLKLKSEFIWSKDVTDNIQLDVHKALVFIFDAVLPFLQLIFAKKNENVWINDNAKTALLSNLSSTLIKFAKYAAPLVPNQRTMKILLGAVRTVAVSAGKGNDKTLAAVTTKFGGRKVDFRTQTEKDYDEFYEQELELNQQFDTFARNCREVYGGENRLSVQLKINPSVLEADPEYCPETPEERLPLGKEFQAHIACFLDFNAANHQSKYRKTTKLLDHLRITAAKGVKSSEKEQREEEDVSIKCLMLLRGIIQNLISIQSNIKSQSDKIRFKEEMQAAEKAICSSKGVAYIITHMDSPSDNVSKQALAVMVTLLHDGNRFVQDELYNHFCSTREERFFVTIMERLNKAAMTLKEKKDILEQNNVIIDETIEELKNIWKARSLSADGHEEATHVVDSMMENAATLLGLETNYSTTKSIFFRKSEINNHSTTYTDDNEKESEDQSEINKELQQIRKELKAEMEKSLLEEVFSDEGYLHLVLRLLSGICDGQHYNIQEYLRRQPDNFKTVNLVAETTRYLENLHCDINQSTIKTVTYIFNAINEMLTNNHENQVVVFEEKICDFINSITRIANFQNCEPSQVMELMLNICILVQTLTEESCVQGNTVDVTTMTLNLLDEVALMKVLVRIYQRSKNLPADDELREIIDQVGYRICHVLLRMGDLKDNITNKNLDKKAMRSRLTFKERMLTAAEDRKKAEEAFTRFESHTGSVELLRVEDSTIHKVYFPIEDPNVIPEKIKVNFNYNVDRNPSTKVNDFIEWAYDITQFVKAEQRYNKYKVAWFFSRFEYSFNMAMMCLSFLLTLLQLITWREPAEGSYKPTYWHSSVYPVFSVIGIIHNIVTTAVLISYFVTRRPELPDTIRRRYFKKEICNEVFVVKEHRNHIEIKLLSFMTFWYILLFIMSILGTCLYGYTFTFHLLHIAEYNQMIRSALKAVTRNGISLLLIFVFGLVFLLIYAEITFAFYRKWFQDESVLWCDTMYQCLVSMVHTGLIVGFYEGIPGDKAKFTDALQKAVFDLTFFIFITTIGLNIIFGLIVDTFAELRDAKWKTDKEMTSTCFICGHDSYSFERYPGGFKKHLTHDHNQWAYIFFFIYLDGKSMNDLTALEYLVYNKLKSQRYDFLPTNRAMCLENNLDPVQMKLIYIQEQLAFLVKHVSILEAEQKRLEDHEHEKQWALQNTSAQGNKGAKGPVKTARDVTPDSPKKPTATQQGPHQGPSSQVQSQGPRQVPLIAITDVDEEDE